MKSVFLSSTGEDLKEYREKALLILRELELLPIAFEDWGAMAQGATEGSKKKLKKSDLYVGIFAHRYGFIEGRQDDSVTEIEFDYARELDMDRLCFLVDSDHPWPPSKVDTQNYHRVEALRQKVEKSGIRGLFTTPEDFGNKFREALGKWKVENSPEERGTNPPAQKLNTLEPVPADFTGRIAVIKDLLDPLAEGLRPIGVIRGAPGVGKTTLALHVAHRLKEKYPHAQLQLDMRGVDPQPKLPEEAMAEVIRAFEPEAKIPDNSEELQRHYRGTLSGRQALLFLDNAAGEKQLAPLIPPEDNMLLITTRYRFKLGGQKAIDLREFSPDEAQDFLRRRDDDDRIGNQADSLANSCGHSPLALRLISDLLYKLPHLTVDDMLERLADRKGLQKELKEVEHCIGLSFDLLPQEMQQSFAELSVFSGNFDRSAAAGVWGVSASEADDVIGDLLGRSLLNWDSKAKKYRLLDLLRSFADGKLKGDERLHARKRHAEYFLSRLKQANSEFLEGGEHLLSALELFDEEWPEMKEAFEWICSNAEDNQSMLKLGSDYSGISFHLLSFRKPNSIQKQWIQKGYEMAKTLGDDAARALHLRRLGWFQHFLFPDLAIQSYEEALEITREQGDRSGEGKILGYLGMTYGQKRESEKAITFINESLAIAREPDVADKRAEGIALGRLGDEYSKLRNFKDAKKNYLEAVMVEREIEDDPGLALDLWKLGRTSAQLDENDEAIGFIKEALTKNRAMGDGTHEFLALETLANVYLKKYELKDALDRIDQLIKSPDSSIEAARKAPFLIALGELAAKGSLSDRSTSFLVQAIAEATRVEESEKRAVLLSAITSLLSRTGHTFFGLEQWVDAKVCWEYCDQLAKLTGDRRQEGNALGNLGCAHAELEEFEQAIDYNEKALAIDRELGDRAGEAQGCWDLGKAYESMGDLQKAIELMEQSLVHGKEVIGSAKFEEYSEELESLRRS